jgi:hypothetical protein
MLGAFLVGETNATRAFSGESNGDEDRKLELLARDHMRGHYACVEGRERCRTVAGAAIDASRCLILVLLQRQYFVLCQEHRLILPR